MSPENKKRFEELINNYVESLLKKGYSMIDIIYLTNLVFDILITTTQIYNIKNGKGTK